MTEVAIMMCHKGLALYNFINRIAVAFRVVMVVVRVRR